MTASELKWAAECFNVSVLSIRTGSLQLCATTNMYHAGNMQESNIQTEKNCL